MSGSGCRRTSKCDLEEVSRHFHGEPIGPGPGRPSKEPQLRWHSGEGNYKEARKSLDATMVWNGEGTMSPGLDGWRQQKHKYSYECSRGRSCRSRSQSRSRSPGHRFKQEGLNDKRGRVTSFDHRNHEPCRRRTIPCKFFASGNCRNGKFCRFSHTDETRESFNNSEPDDRRQGIDNRVYIAPLTEGSKWSETASDVNASTRCGYTNEGLGEQRAMKRSVDVSAGTNNRFMPHPMNSAEATINNGSSHFSLTAHSSSVLGVSELRDTAIRGVDTEGSVTYTGNHLPIMHGTSRKPDVLDTVISEPAKSGPCLMSTEQFSNLTVLIARLLEDGKQLPEVFAALSASNSLGFMQSSGSADVASSSSQYDPVNDSLELIKSVISEQQDEIALQSQLPLTGDPGGDGLYGTDCKDVELNVNSHQSSGKDTFADCKNEEHSIVKAEELKEWKDGGKLKNNEGDGEADERKKNNDEKSLRAFKFSLAEFVKELLRPIWKEGKINKEAHKTIVKKVVDKVTFSVQGVHIPQTQEQIDNYLSASKLKISKLVQAYVEKVQKEKMEVA